VYKKLKTYETDISSTAGDEDNFNAHTGGVTAVGDVQRRLE